VHAEAVLKLLADGDSGHVRLAAVQLLAGRGEAGHVHAEAVLKLLADGDSGHVRLAAVQLLAGMCEAEPSIYAKRAYTVAMFPQLSEAPHHHGEAAGC
jgi:predicted TPR repeat methyltransferase